MKKKLRNTNRRGFLTNLFSKYFIIFFLPVIFFVLALSTISDYGMNWDSPVHFARGQAFLHYFLTGKTNYNDSPKNCLGKDKFPSRVDYKTKEVCDLHRKTRVSEYESTILDFDYFKKDIYGHPPTSDLFLAASNVIFFKTLGLVEDLHAYHLYNIFTTFLLALTVAVWAYMTFGKFASALSVLTLYLYPLLSGEQQFNVKDPPMAAFFTLSLFLFWLAITKKSWKMMLLSAIAGGISFGTKFNFVFAPFILSPWLIIYIGSRIFERVKKEKKSKFRSVIKYCATYFPRDLGISLLAYPVIVFSIFYFSWPVIWPDPVHNVLLVIKFYQDIGGGSCPYIPFTPSWISGCSDLIPLTYFFTTIPLVSLFLFGVGFFVSIKKIKTNDFVTLLWLIFFLFIFTRVTLPFSKTYGGIRQIIEFIGPFSLIAAVGGTAVRTVLLKILQRFGIFSKKNQLLPSIVAVLILCLYIPIFLKLHKIHPNENVYFNPIVGGIKGAAEMKMYGFGNTYGNAYYQAARWLNLNAEKNSKVVLLWGLNQNISRQSLREDVTHLGPERSGYFQNGEYQITTMEQGNPVYNTFRYKFADRFLQELYAMKVEGVPLLRIWKNDKRHLRPGINLDAEQIIVPLRKDDESKKEIDLMLQKSVLLKRIEFRFAKSSCKLPAVGTKILYGSSEDDLVSSNDEINDFTLSEVKKYKADFVYLFAAEDARLVKILLPESYPCPLSDVSLSIFSFTGESKPL